MASIPGPMCQVTKPVNVKDGTTRLAAARTPGAVRGGESELVPCFEDPSRSPVFDPLSFAESLHLPPTYATIGPDPGTGIPIERIEAEQQAWLRAGEIVRTSLLGGLTFTIRRHFYNDTIQDALERAEAVANLEQLAVAAGGLYATGKAAGTISTPPKPKDVEHVGGLPTKTLGDSRVVDLDPSTPRAREACVTAAAAVIARTKEIREKLPPEMRPATVTIIEQLAKTLPIGTGTGELRIESVPQAINVIEAATGANLRKAYFKDPGLYVFFIPEGSGAHAIIGWIRSVKAGVVKAYLFDPSGQNYPYFDPVSLKSFKLGKASQVDLTNLNLPPGTGQPYRVQK